MGNEKNTLFKENVDEKHTPFQKKNCDTGM